MNINNIDRVSLNNSLPEHKEAPFQQLVNNISVPRHLPGHTTPKTHPLPKIPLPRSPLPITGPHHNKTDSDYTVGSFNTYSASDSKGTKGEGLDNIKKYAEETDIIGFQETGGASGAKVAGTMIDAGKNGYVPNSSGGNPIYWNKDKFDLVYSEDLKFHDPHKRGPGVPKDEPTTDQLRTSSIVILRDKSTGNEILVSNAHTDNDYNKKDLTVSRDAQLQQLADREKELKESHPGIQATINLGDYNQPSSGALESNNNISNNPSDSEADHILINGENGGEVTNKGESNEKHPDNDDDYHHRPLIQSFHLGGNQSVEENENARQDSIVNNNGRGAVLYEDDGYNDIHYGEKSAWVIGFGNDTPPHKEWNDKTTSVKMSDNINMELYENADFSGKKIDLDESTSNVGDKMNDKTSAYNITYD